MKTKKKFDLAAAHLNTGKIWDDSADLEEIAGREKPKQSKVSVASLNEYKTKLEQMNKFDLEKHAISMYVTPRDNRDNLIAQLLKEFSG